MPDQKRGEDSPDGAAVLLVGAAEDQDIGTGWPAGFARKDPAAPLMDVHGRDTTPQTGLWPDEFWIGKRRLVFLQGASLAGDDRSALLFGRTGLVEVRVAAHLRVGGPQRFLHTFSLPAGAF